MLDIEEQRRKKVLSSAQAVWARFYGQVRVSGAGNRTSRRDLGCPRPEKPDQDKKSLAGWLRQRKQEVENATLRLRGSQRPGGDLQEYFWARSHEQEMEFVKAWGRL